MISPPSCERCGANAQGTQEKNLHESESRSALKNEKNLHESESRSALNCFACAGKKFYFEKNFAMFSYENILREILLDMKFNSKKRIAEGLGFLWLENLKDFLRAVPAPDFGEISRKGNRRLDDAKNFNENAVDFDEKKIFFEKIFRCGEEFFFVPMPMHKNKKRERGFNQAEIITLPLAKFFDIPVSNVLLREKFSPPQSEVAPSRREQNVKNIFAINPRENPRGKNFIVTDDIFTTGASLNECAKILKNAGANKVFCMTLAISVKNICKH